MDTEKTLVILREYPDGDILALFPENEFAPLRCESYMHIGQHGGANYQGCISATKPASLEDENVQLLISELEGIGYNLKIRKRWNR